MTHQTRAKRGALLAALFAAALAGCGGGGGGGSSSGTGTTPTPKAVTITGTLQDKSTSYALPNRTVQVQIGGRTVTSGMTNMAGQFSIASVPTVQIMLVITDSNGSANGTVPENLSGGNGNLGTIVLDLSGVPPPPGH